MGRTGCIGIGISPPRRITAWLFSWLFKGKRKKVRYQSDSRDESVEPVGCTADGLEIVNRFNSVAESDDPGITLGSHTREMISFNTGIGCCLLYLIAAGNSEIQKLLKLRSEMESFLEMAKDELRANRLPSKPSQPTTSYACSTTDIREASESNNGLCPRVISTSYILPESSESVLSNQSPRCDVSMRGHGVRELDQLEAEFEAELKLLQLVLDPESRRFTQHAEQHTEKVTMKGAASSTSHSFSPAEVTDFDAVSSNMPDFGVSPYELERKLHKLLETRQREQIKELEAAIDAANHKISEKEAEVLWWKDTAYLFLQRVPQSVQARSETLV